MIRLLLLLTSLVVFSRSQRLAQQYQQTFQNSLGFSINDLLRTMPVKLTIGDGEMAKCEEGKSYCTPTSNLYHDDDNDGGSGFSTDEPFLTDVPKVTNLTEGTTPFSQACIYCTPQLCAHEVPEPPSYTDAVVSLTASGTPSLPYWRPLNASHNSPICQISVSKLGDTARIGGNYFQNCSRPELLLSRSENYTLTFTITSLTANITSQSFLFFRIFLPMDRSKVLEGVPNIYFRYGVNKTQSGQIAFTAARASHGAPYESLSPIPSQTMLNELNITLQFIRSDDGYRIYHYTNGEIAEIVHLPADFDQNVTSTAFQVYLQGSDMLYSNIKLYNIIVLASELYELRTGRKVEYRVVPECKCPRDNPDDFGRWGAVSRGVTVTAIADCGSTPRIYHGDERRPSQLSASVNIEEVVLTNSANGGLRYDYAEWISDYTESIDLYIDLHQNMQIFAVSLVTSNIPEKLEVYFSGGYSQRRAVVYLADDCNAAYNKKPNQLAFTDTFQESANRFRRAALNEPTVRCYEWKSVAIQSFLEVQTNSELYEVLIPIVGTSDFNNALDPHYIGQEIHIRMIGHLLAEEDDQRYYSITAGQLQVYGRPFCNGANSQFRELTDYNSYTGYYEYLQTMNEPYYTCQCPSNITGSDCTSCNANQTWQITPAVCVDCECSDLSVGPDCDQKTGQCPCIDGMDLELAGRHCNFYMDSIDPLYGPRSGGTRITFSGFFDTDNYRVDLRVHSGNYRVQLEWNTTTFSNGTGLVTTSEYKVSNSRYAPEFPTEVTLEFILIDIRDSKVLIQFQYRPDPIIEEIYPRQMPLSGGTISRVYGKYINSVAYPSMTIDIRVENMTYGTFETGCTVINETLMECETPNLLEFWVNFTRRQTSVPLPAPTTRGATEPATSITATTLSTPRPTGTTTPTGFNGTGGQPLVRRKRQTKSSPPDGINEDYLNGQYKISFIMGFKLDGVDKFEDLSQVENLREQAEIFVFRDPIVEAFDPEIQDYKSGLIEIKGSGMTSGVIMSDYDIEIGKGKCDMKALDDNRLTCQPPEEEPEIDRDSSIEDHPHVRVRVGNRETFLGYLKYFSSPWDYAWVRGVVITVIVIVGLAVLAVIVWYCVKMKRRERDFKLRQRSMQKKLENKYHPNQTGQMTEKSALFAELHQNLRTTIARCEIPADRLTKGGVVGKGNFGRVYKGQLVLPNGMMKAVAVKSLKENDVTVEVIEDFLKEALIMVDFRHDNVLSLIGVVWEEGDRPMVVIPYMDNGDLRKVVMNSDIRLTLGDLLHFCYQISNGMEYLGDKKFVHRDLAARNCMVNGEGKLKIADFGLSRDLFEKDYYKIQDETRGLPIKWMAIESIVHGKFTSKSDVWSFAVTCWEVFTLGSTPYPAVDNYSMRKHIERGGRLDKPPNCPDIIFEMMKRCWFDAPEERPSFGSISQLLANILHIDNDPQQEQDQLETAYDRAYTIEIPDDYLNASAGQSDDYMYFQPMAAEESENVPPKPAARFQAAAPDNVYINV